MKNEALKNIKEEIIDPNSLPKEEFSESDFFKFWNIYVQNLHQNGEKIQAANLEMGQPILKNTTIELEVPNNIAKTEILREENKILGFLRKSLRNYEISLKIIENEQLMKKYIVTPDDKYERLLEINPLLHEFRKALELNLEF